MDVSVVHPGELGASELAVWRRIQRTSGDLRSPFLAPEFTVAVGRVRPRSRVAVLSESSGIIGFFPFELRSLGYGVPIAAGLSDYQGPVIEPDMAWDPVGLLRKCGLAVWEFDHLVDAYPCLDSHVVLRATSPLIDLSSGFDAYFAQRRKSSEIKNLMRRGRKLARDVGELRLVLDSSDEGALRTVLRWKSAQYQRTGRSDRFAQPWITELIHILHADHGPDFWGQLSLLYAGEHLVAGAFGLRAGHVLAGWFPSYDPRIAKYSPGLLQQVETARASADAGVVEINLGRGTKMYKEILKSQDTYVAEGRVLRPAPAAALYWAGRAPLRKLRNTVVARPTLFRIADGALRAAAAARIGVRRARALPVVEDLS